MNRARFLIQGIVQGVGFRPFVYGLARRLGLTGYVLNNSNGVEIVLEGPKDRILDFEKQLLSSPPPRARIIQSEKKWEEPVGISEFTIKESCDLDTTYALISPDIATCPDCLKELHDPDNYRYGYPFINCTNCGPRFTITYRIPYDRKNTTMARFTMCPVCQRQYDDPSDRRFHAQPNACAICGPEVILYKNDGTIIETEDPIGSLAMELKRGRSALIKGLGGFHLACDATNSQAVKNLRYHKEREEKPFAIMVPDMEWAESLCELTEADRDLLTCFIRPIVIAPRKPDADICPEVAPGQKTVGMMLPYTPLHHLLMEKVSRPLIMTSGNFSDEPIIYRDDVAKKRLAPFVDYLLLHNRDIYARCDDSVVRTFRDKPYIIRRARGYAPDPLLLPWKSEKTILACGAELKNTFCILKEDRAYISQHIGDLKNPETLDAFRHSLDHFKQIFKLEPEIIAYDLHPDYQSTRFGLEETGDLPKIGIQHHHAHIISVLAEKGIKERVIGVSADGTGYGEDKKIWGGEWLIADFKSFKRLLHLKYVPLLGGDKAVWEPWRMALSYLYPLVGELLVDLPLGCITRVTTENWPVLLKMLRTGLSSPLTSSMGRLFDAVSAILGIRLESHYEAQASMELEQVSEVITDCSYPFEIKGENYPLQVDPAPMIEEILWAVLKKEPVSKIGGIFHNTIALMIREACRRARDESGLNKVALSGGVFQNMLLLNLSADYLEKDGFTVITHSQIPTNDGGISLGQAVIAAEKLKN
ncbi:MAG: carbamoyltransferase HypF [Candidatus Eremiobacteraeota bacterium]|nr:carbamoyltransferase HypF [Candidatus Eremiobacteraeota bacterium]